MNRNRYALIGAFLGIAASIGSAAILARTIPGERRGAPDWHHGRGSHKPHQGKGEIARRRGQIERGQLREQNGLVRG